MLRRLESKLLKRNIVLLSIAALLVVVIFTWDRLLCFMRPLSRDAAFKTALIVLDDLEKHRNPTGKKWIRPTIIDEVFYDKEEFWTFRFSSVGCSYSIDVNRCGAADISGIGGCNKVYSRKGSESINSDIDKP